MIRAFLGLPLPDPLIHVLTVAQHRLRLARPIPPENLHVTLAFLGEQPEPVLEELHHALVARPLPAVVVQVTGLGVFGGDKPRSLHATLSPDPGLEALQGRVAAAVRAVGLGLERRRFVPHVTLARFRPGETSAPALAAMLGAHGPLVSEPVEVGEMILYRSTLRRDGSVYDPLAEYPLTV
ncbi:MAG: RNA 2',3'-cyclic phosphodiesterase [Rhodobacteraceae bacterium]|nr:RNA 2',3'-cyclic phosphodiesterase [Paracoccaceae bacterium]